MNTCPKCQTQVQSDALFCEACGTKLDQQYPQEEEAAAETASQPGSLKERLAVLSGPLRQLKAKWPKKSSQPNTENRSRGQESDYQAEAGKTSKRSGKVLNFLISVIVGIGLIAFWVWLLMRKTGERLVRLFF